MATAGEPSSNRRLRTARVCAAVSAVLALGVGGCGGGESDAIDVTTTRDDGDGDAGAALDAASHEPTNASDDGGKPLDTDAAGEGDETLPADLDASAPSSDSSTDEQTQPTTASDAAIASTNGDDAGVTADASANADASIPAGAVEVYAEPGYCSLYLDRGERGHRLECSVVMGDLWSCYSFTPVAPFAEFYLADQRSFTVSAPPTQDVCSLLVEPLFGQGADAFAGDEDDCEQWSGSAGPQRWQAQVCGPKATLGSESAVWEGEPALLAVCERRDTQSVAPLCGCGKTAIERQYIATDHDLATALAATWAYCSAPEAPSLTGSVSCDTNGSTEGEDSCMIEAPCSQPEQKSADSEATMLRHFDKRVLCEPALGAAEPAVTCVCEGVIDGVDGVSFAAADATLETCETLFSLCTPGQPEIAGAAVCTLIDEYQVGQEGCGVSLTCSVPLFINGINGTTTTKADLYCDKLSDTTLWCSSNAENAGASFEVTDVDFDTACETALTRFIEESEQAPVLP